MKKTKEVVTIDLTEYNLQENKAKQIGDLYLPMIQMLGDMEAEFNTLVEKTVTPELSVQARDLRLRIKNVRVAADKARKEGKAESLRIGNAIQGVYNTLEYAVKSKEETLLAIENHLAELESKRLDGVAEERAEALKPYGFDNQYVDLRNMDDDKWQLFLAGVMAAHEKSVAEAEAAKEREEEEARISTLRDTRKESIIDLWQFVDDKLRTQDFGKIADDAWGEIVESLLKKKVDEDKKQRLMGEENTRLEKLARSKAAETARLAAELNAKQEEEARRLLDEKAAKVATAAAAQKEQEAKAEAERQAKLAPDKEKLLQLRQKIEALDLPKLQDPGSNMIVRHIGTLLGKVTTFINQESEKL